MMAKKVVLEGVALTYKVLLIRCAVYPLCECKQGHTYKVQIYITANGVLKRLFSSV